MLTLSYADRRGGWTTLAIRSEPELMKRLKTLRTFATVKNEQGETVGGIEEAEGQDDRRIRWNWWVCVPDVRAGLSH